MNFDVLLEEACDAENVDYVVTNSFEHAGSLRARSPHGTLIIIKPHGSLRSAEGENTERAAGSLIPVLELEKGNLFEHVAERTAAEELLTQNHVLSIGYRGSDVKIAEVLGAAKDPNQLERAHLFFVNPLAPDDHLQPALAARRSAKLQISGRDAYFTNFMEMLYQELNLDGHASSDPLPTFDTAAIPPLKCEDRALEECKRLALRIRSGMSVAESASLRLEEHAEEVFLNAVNLAEGCWLSLTQTEQFVLRATTFFHDLGYYWSRSSGNPERLSGLTLLQQHGEASAELLSRYVNRQAISNLVPQNYDDPNATIECILELCRLHSKPPLKSQETREISIDGIGVPYRPFLLQALMHVVEELLGGHPRLRGGPSLINQGYVSLNDPILELHLQQSDAIQFQICSAPPRIRIDNSKAELAKLKWSLHRIDRVVRRLSEISVKLGGVAVELQVRNGDQDSLPQEAADEGSILHVALRDDLNELVKTELSRMPGGALASLDLLLLYTHQLPGAREEPRLSLDDGSDLADHARDAFEIIEGSRYDPARDTALYYYFHEVLRGRDSFAELYKRYFLLHYPAWRYLARFWRLGISPMDFAPTILEAGSSRVRPELPVGARSVLRDKLFLCAPPKAPAAYWGHQGCMQCTGLALQTLARLRQRLTNAEIEHIEPRFDEFLSGILRFTLSFKLDDLDWMGLYDQKGTDPQRRILSPSYLSQVIIGLVDVLEMDQHLEGTEGASWLKTQRIKRGQVTKVLEERLAFLNDPATWSSNLSRFEEGSTSWGAAVARACLALRRLNPSSKISDALLDFLEARTHGESDVQRFRTIPILTLIAEIREAEGAQRAAAREVLSCIQSPIWIKQPGEGFGSWGYNPSTTEGLISALLSFWRYAYRHRDRMVEVFQQLSDVDGKPPVEEH